MLGLCALTLTAGAHELYWFSEYHSIRQPRFQLYNNCNGVVVGFQLDSRLSEGFAGSGGSIRRDVREKLESASILRSGTNLQTNDAKDKLVVSVTMMRESTMVEVYFLKLMHDPITKLDGQVEAWETFRLARPGAAETDLAIVVLALLRRFVAEYTKANEDCAPFKIE